MVGKTMPSAKDVECPERNKQISTLRRNQAQLSVLEDEMKQSTDRPELGSLLKPWLALAATAVCIATWTIMRDDGDIKDAMVESQDAADAAWLPRALKEKMDKLTFTEDHKSLQPLDTTDYVGFFFATLGLVVAAGGGIGGGGILVPIYILVMGFSPKHAIPLSNITVFGGALANTALNWPKRHPHANRPLVDWDLIMVMEPLTIAGALIGAFLNKLLNETLLVVMLVALLSFTAYNTLKKSMKMYAIETKHIQEELRLRGDGTKESELTRIAKDIDHEDEEEAGESLLVNEEIEMEDELKQILEEEQDPPMRNIMILGIMFVVVLVVNIVKGGGAFPSPLGITCGSMSFWAANGLMLGWIIMISLYARKYLVQRFDLKEKVNYQYAIGDIQWDERTTIVYPLICCLAGLFAGMFGVGGGIVKGPLMLAMNVHPAVSSASSACMILFTSFTATTSFIVFGLLIPDYAVVCVVIGFLATLVGQTGLSYLMAKSQRNSYIAFSIGGVVLLSAFLMTIQSLVSMAEGSHSTSGGICGKGD